MSFTALSSALSGLRVAQQQLSVISNNVANATTPGYTRKLLPQSTQTINNTGESIGVISGKMIRQVDMNLTRELWTQVSSVSALDVKASYLDTIEKFHGPTNKELSIAALIADLKDDFAALSDSPSNGYLLQTTLSQAQLVSGKFNDFGELLNRMRNDAQDDMVTTVGRINDLLSSIATLNGQIKGTNSLNRSSAGIEDQRDNAVKELSTLMTITTFTRGDGVMVVQSSTGVQLTDERPTPLFFNAQGLSPTSTYPSGASGVYVGGDPTVNHAAADITKNDVGGKLGGLIDLRDDILVRYQGQLDELAHKLAFRMDAQGLRLFTDPTGNVPADTPPDPTTNPPTPVKYVGFAMSMRVNDDVINDLKLIQQGTYASDRTIPAASNEVIRRVIQYGFGDVNYQQAAGVINLNVALPATDLQGWLGLHSGNKVVSGVNLSDFSQISDGVAGTSDMMADLQEWFPNYPNNDIFRITVAEPRLGLGPTNIDIDLSAAQAAFPLSGSVHDALDQIVAQINARITAAGLPAGLTTTATRNTNGQLVINSRADVTIGATGFANAMGNDALDAIGLKAATYKTEDPYFDVQVGSGEPVRIKIAPGDTAATLVTKLQYNPATGAGVPGLHVSLDAGTGRLTLRPGMDDTNGGPDFGGDIKIISGPGLTSGAVNATIAALPQGVSVIGALFGGYTVAGGVVTEASPVKNVLYGSETRAGSGVFVAFRRDYLGPAADVTNGITTGMNVVDFGSKMVNAQAQDIILNKSKQGDETAVRDMLNERVANETGVNIDEELSQLIVVQTAYSAAARAISAANDMFQDLLNSVR